MMSDTPKFLLLEPYYGGSHRAFLLGLQKHLDFSFTLISLPARKWKMRMQLAAPWFAAQIKDLYKAGNRYDGILTSSFLDVAVLRARLQQAGLVIPLAVYFHENQFAYPHQVASADHFQFTAINFNSALAADTIGFNSSYNRDTFFAGVRFYLKKAADIEVKYLADELEKKSLVLYPGIDFSAIDTAAAPEKNERSQVPVIVWNHRWEYDKDPDTFFEALMALAKKNIPFKLIVLGESFRYRPEIFDRVAEQFKGILLHFGYVKNRAEYANLLKKSDIVVSTAKHEFFGIAVLEAVRAGCRPLVPDRLSYRELFDQRFRYQPGQLEKELKSLLLRKEPLLEPGESYQMTKRFSWPEIATAYREWLLDGRRRTED